MDGFVGLTAFGKIIILNLTVDQISLPEQIVPTSFVVQLVTNHYPVFLILVY